ncbi:hypothetical protein Bhyg_02186 [Pseudolycoriella hygida]|uniref:Uncharacterized protein n=1 Tax=Pseudolycoriella hygida TaxID=35572 RepID=A0A9Q0NCS3_9DIPT|nr:hypothetical protein Bhyg_02186 [Pseudolycoriella hygida]
MESTNHPRKIWSTQMRTDICFQYQSNYRWLFTRDIWEK